MLIDNYYRHIHIYENAFSQFFDRRDVTHFLAVYKGAEPGQPGPSQKQRCRTNKRKNFFSNRIVDTWKSLPPEIVESPNINTFKSRLNEFWKSLPVKFNPSFYKY